LGANPFSGVILLAIGGLCSATNFIPFRQIKRWSWEVYWPVQAFAAWVMVPIVAACVLVPNCCGILRQALHLDSHSVWLSLLFGMAWGVGGWLLTPFLAGAGAETLGRLRARVAAELTTTFASNYTREVSLAGMLRPDAFNSYLRRATGEKFLVTPQVVP